MFEFDTVKTTGNDPFMITWDLGRRCNFDCSYCPSHRHNNTSKHSSLDELIETSKFIQEYILLLYPHRKDKNYYISFTGGEPTVNPNFIKFAEYINTEWKSAFPSDININLDVTTNGAMSSKIAESIIQNFDHVTISYHAETDIITKQNVFERIMQLHNGNLKMKINVMMHADKFTECVEFCEKLKENNVRYIPRPIGEDPNSILSTAHKYTDEQKKWFSSFFNTEMTQTTRPCCGGRSFTVCNKSESKETKVIWARNFKEWHCSVNLYFLHIEQETDSVYHHQTCQATFNKARGIVGTLSKWKDITDTLKNNLDNKTMPTVICPNKLCGCGICIPKSQDKDTYFNIISSTIDPTVLKQ